MEAVFLSFFLLSMLASSLAVPTSDQAAALPPPLPTRDPNHKKEMIARSNLAEQLRDYQIRSKNQWATLAFLSSTSTSSYRADTTILLLQRCMFSSLVFSGVAFYFGCTRLALSLICMTFIILTSMRLTKKIRQNRKYKQRMLLPLSM